MIIISCPYNHDDCINCNQCHLCFNGSKYKPAKKKQQGLNKNFNKQSNRMGAQSETKVQKTNQATIDNVCSSRLTANSGAGFGSGTEKGDAWITGLVEISQEVKTQLPDRAKGCKSFTIQREWLEKLDYESRKANKEFWWLVFSFKETDNQMYIVCDNQVFQDMTATLVADRKTASEAQHKIDLANKQKKVIEAKNTELQATIDRLQVELEYYKLLADYTQVKMLINKYEKEASEIYDEFMHGDSSARQEAYNTFIKDLKSIINKDGEGI